MEDVFKNQKIHNTTQRTIQLFTHNDDDDKFQQKNMYFIYMVDFIHYRNIID